MISTIPLRVSSKATNQKHSSKSSSSSSSSTTPHATKNADLKTSLTYLNKQGDLLYQEPDYSLLYFHRHVSILSLAFTIYLILEYAPRGSLFHWLDIFRNFSFLLRLLIILELGILVLKLAALWYRTKYPAEEGSPTAAAEKSSAATSSKKSSTFLRGRKFNITDEDWNNAKLLGMTIEDYMQQKDQILGTKQPAVSAQPVTTTTTATTAAVDEDLDDLFQGPAIQMRDEYNSQEGSYSSSRTNLLGHNLQQQQRDSSSDLRNSSLFRNTATQPFLRRTPNYLKSVQWTDQSALIHDKNHLKDYLNQYKKNPYSISSKFVAGASSGASSTGVSTSPYGVPSGAPSTTVSRLQPKTSYRGIPVIEPQDQQKFQQYPSAPSFSLNQDFYGASSGTASFYSLAPSLGFSVDFLRSNEDLVPHLHEAYKQSQAALKQLNVQPQQLASWADNVRKWIVDNILRNLSSTVESLDKEFKNRNMTSYDCHHVLDEPPRMDTRIPDNIPPPIDGRLTLRHILAVCCQNDAFIKNRLIIEHYLDIPFVPRDYILKRIKELSSSAYMDSYRWNSGGSFEGRKWEQRKDLPNDSQLVMHLFRKWMDLLFPSDSRYGQMAFTIKHFVDGGRTGFSGSGSSGIYGSGASSGGSSSDSTLYILQENVQPPHFSLVFKNRPIRVEPGRNNLFYTLCLFIHIVKTDFRGTLDQMWLGTYNYNLLKIVSSTNSTRDEEGINSDERR